MTSVRRGSGLGGQCTPFEVERQRDRALKQGTWRAVLGFVVENREYLRQQREKQATSGLLHTMKDGAKKRALARAKTLINTVNPVAQRKKQTKTHQERLKKWKDTQQRKLAQYDKHWRKRLNSYMVTLEEQPDDQAAGAHNLDLFFSSSVSNHDSTAAAPGPAAAVGGTGHSESNDAIPSSSGAGAGASVGVGLGSNDGTNTGNRATRNWTNGDRKNGPKKWVVQFLKNQMKTKRDHDTSIVSVGQTYSAVNRLLTLEDMQELEDTYDIWSWSASNAKIDRGVFNERLLSVSTLTASQDTIFSQFTEFATRMWSTVNTRVHGDWELEDFTVLMTLIRRGHRDDFCAFTFDLFDIDGDGKVSVPDMFGCMSMNMDVVFPEEFGHVCQLLRERKEQKLPEIIVRSDFRNLAGDLPMSTPLQHLCRAFSNPRRLSRNIANLTPVITAKPKRTVVSAAPKRKRMTTKTRMAEKKNETPLDPRCGQKRFDVSQAFAARTMGINRFRHAMRAKTKIIRNGKLHISGYASLDKLIEAMVASSKIVGHSLEDKDRFAKVLAATIAKYHDAELAEDYAVIITELLAGQQLSVQKLPSAAVLRTIIDGTEEEQITAFYELLDVDASRSISPSEVLRLLSLPCASVISDELQQLVNAAVDALTNPEAQCTEITLEGFLKVFPHPPNVCRVLRSCNPGNPPPASATPPALTSSAAASTDKTQKSRRSSAISSRAGTARSRGTYIAKAAAHSNRSTATYQHHKF
jgi:Ca2+-binding EF-hand superfamily protein